MNKKGLSSLEGSSLHWPLTSIDLIRGYQREEPVGDERLLASQKGVHTTAAHKVVVIMEHGLVVIGVDVRDRPGLLLDISKALSSLKLNVRHTEACVVGQRSISIWRCELIETDIADLDAIWSVLNVSVEIHTSSVWKMMLLKAIFLTHIAT